MRSPEKPLDPAQWAPSSATPTLIIDGDKSDPTFRNAAADLARIVPHAERLTLAGQNHGAVEMAPQSIAPALIDFFAK